MTAFEAMQAVQGWPSAAQYSDDLLAYATGVALDAMSDAGDNPVSRRLARYYDPSLGWAATSFLEMTPIEPNTITATDLHALTLLHASVGASVTRQLLLDGPIRAEIESVLADIEPTADLASVEPPLLDAMDALWDAIYRGCSDPRSADPNPWVTASKLCARKRPSLFPVRDRIVCEGLHLYGVPQRRRGDRHLDWSVFSTLIADPVIFHAVDTVTARVRADYGIRCDQHRLRVLDVALWTYLREA